MKSGPDKVKRQPWAKLGSFSLPAVLGLCFALFAAAGCSRSHLQETVTVAPRATALPTPGVPDASPGSVPPAVDRETEAAGDALAHAMVALKRKHRDEALYFMNLARTRLTALSRRLNHSAADGKATSNPTREQLINNLRALDAAERSARHNDYQQGVSQLHSISDELDLLSANLVHRQN